MSLKEKIIEAQKLGEFNHRIYVSYRNLSFWLKRTRERQIKYQNQSADQYRLARLMMGITE